MMLQYTYLCQLLKYRHCFMRLLQRLHSPAVAQSVLLHNTNLLEKIMRLLSFFCGAPP